MTASSTLFTLAACGLLVSSLTAAQPVRYQSTPGASSTVRIDGTSTFHDWTVESKLIGGSMQLDATFPEKPEEAIKLQPKVDVIIPIRSLKSTSGKPEMDSVMYRTMKYEQHPKITYQLTEMTLKEPAKEPGGPMVFATKGELTIAGVKKSTPLNVTIQPMAGDKLKVTGTTSLKMTDFGMQPPSPKLALGLVKTGDDVKITFEWMTAKKEEEKK